MMMKKLLLVLLAIVLVSGCVQNSVGDNSITDDNKMEYHEGECRLNSNCLVVYCRDTPENTKCMNTVQVLTEMKCQELGGIGSDKNYEDCGCVEQICQ